MALEGGEVHSGNVVNYLPVGLYSTRASAFNLGGVLKRSLRRMPLA